MSRMVFLLDSIAGWLFNGLINSFMKVVMFLWFMLQSVIAIVLDLLTQLFFIFGGMTPVSSKTEFDPDTGKALDTDVVNFFLTKDVFREAYLSLSLVALGLVIVFTIGKIIKQDYFEKAGPRSKGPIFRNVALSFIAFLCVIPIFYFIIGASSALALLVMKALGYEGGGIGTMIFNMSWSDGGKSFIAQGEEMAGSDMRDDNYFGWYSLDTFYAYFWNPDVAEFKEYRPAEYYWWVFLFTGLVLIGNLFKMLLAMITRMFKLIALFIIAPSPISQIVLDDGAKFKSWKDKVIQESVKIVGCVMSFMIFLLIAGAVNDLDLARYAFSPEAASAKNLLDSNAVTTEVGNDLTLLYYGNAATPGGVDNLINTLCKAFLLIAGVGAIQDIDSTITPFLAGGSSSMDLGATGKGLMSSMSAVAKGALDITKQGVGLATSAVGGAAGLVSGIGSNVAQGIEKMKSRKLDEEAAKDKLGGKDKENDEKHEKNEGAATPLDSEAGKGGGNDEGGSQDKGQEGAQATESQGNTGEKENNEGGTPPTDQDQGESKEKDEGSEEAQNPEPQGQPGEQGESKEEDKGETEKATAPTDGSSKNEKSDEAKGDKAEVTTGKKKLTKAEKIVAANDKKVKKAEDKAKEKADKKLKSTAKKRNTVAKNIGTGLGMLIPLKPALKTAGKLGKDTAKFAAKATSTTMSTLLKATGLGGVAEITDGIVDIGKTAVSGIANTAVSTAKEIGGQWKEYKDMKQANVDKAKEIVDNKPKAPAPTAEPTAEEVSKSTNGSLTSASEQGSIASSIGNTSQEAAQLSMDGYDSANQANEQHIVAENNMLAAQDKYDEVNSRIEQKDAEIKGYNKVLSSKEGKQYVNAMDKLADAKTDSARNSLLNKIQKMEQSEKYNDVRKAYSDKTNASNDLKGLYKERSDADKNLSDAKGVEQKARENRDNALGSSTIAVQTKIASSNLSRMMEMKSDSSGDKKHKGRAAYASNQVNELKTSTNKLSANLSDNVQKVTKQNDGIAKQYGHASGAQMRDSDSYTSANQNLNAAFDSYSNIKDTYSDAGAAGINNNDVAELDDSGYNKVASAKKEFGAASQEREQLENELKNLESKGGNKKQMKAIEKKLDDAKVREDRALYNVEEVSGGKQTAATRYRLAVDEYSSTYQDYQSAKESGDEKRIEQTRASYYEAKQNMEKCQNEVNDIVVRVSFANQASGVASRQKANSGATQVANAGAPYRNDVGGSIVNSARQGKNKEVELKIVRSFEKGEISNDLGQAAIVMFTGNDFYSNGIDGMVDKLPDVSGVDVSQIEEMLSSMTSVPDKSYYHKNGIHTMDQYRSDVKDRYMAAKNSYEQSMTAVKENFARYKNDNNDVAALNAVRDAMGKVISASANMSHIRAEVEIGKK